MPWAPRRPCPAPGCPRLLAPGERCPDHAPAPFSTSTYQRGRPPIPDRLRRQVLERDGHTCQWLDDAGICGAPATDVDHVIPRAAGGTDDPANLRAICARHHRAKTGREARAMRRH